MKNITEVLKPTPWSDDFTQEQGIAWMANEIERQLAHILYGPKLSPQDNALDAIRAVLPPGIRVLAADYSKDVMNCTLEINRGVVAPEILDRLIEAGLIEPLQFTFTVPRE